MTEDDRLWLAGAVAAQGARRRFARSTMAVLLLVVVPVAGGVVLLLLLLLLGLMGAWPFGARMGAGAIQWAQPVVFGVCFLIGAAGYAAERARERRAKRQTKERMDRDLAAGTVEEDRHVVLARKLFREPEYGMFFHFLKLESGEVLTLYDKDSVRDEGADAPTLAIRRHLAVITFPHSQLTRLAFSGPDLPAPAPRDLTAAPVLWPKDRGWCAIKWEALEQRLSG